MLSDVETGNNLMLTRMVPVATLDHFHILMLSSHLVRN